MLAKIQDQKIFLFGILALLMITRASHFGNASLLPDASIACFFLLGAMHARLRWVLLASLIAVAIDLLVTRLMIVSDYCMSPAYWGLLPIYALVWWLGRRLGNNLKLSLKNFILFGWFSASIAFFLSNAIWYPFSEQVNKMSLADFSSAVSQYYLPYTAYSVFYIIAAYAILFVHSHMKSVNTIEKA